MGRSLAESSSKSSSLLKNSFFNRLCAVHGCTAIFTGCKPLKMLANRKPRFSVGYVEIAMDGFFNILLAAPDYPPDTDSQQRNDQDDYKHP